MKVMGTVFTWLIVIVFCPPPASADNILFNNLGPNDFHDDHRALWFGFEFGQEEDPDDQVAQAVSFSPSVTGTLSTLELPLEFPWSFQDGSFELNLYTAAGVLPGERLESWSADGPYLPTALTTFTSLSQPVLLAGALYFLEVRAIGMADGLWYLTNEDPDQRVPGAFRQHEGAWLPITRLVTPALRVTGEVAMAPTPEPATLVLIGSGLALAALRRRRSLP